MTTISIAEMEAARARTADFLHVTPTMSSQKIDNEVIGGGAHLLFKCEHLQKTGSFKARGALNSAILAKEKGAKGVIAHSSGNHGQALAWAAQLIGIPCTIVVPKNAPQSKIDGMREYQADIVFCEPTVHSRESTCAELAKKLEYDTIEPFNCVSMINGHASLAMEIIEEGAFGKNPIDSIFLSIGGGGLATSIAYYIGNQMPNIKVFLVEPQQKALSNLLENDVVCPTDTLTTIADGVRVARVGSLCEPILKQFCVGNVISVTEDEIKKALKLVWSRLKQRVEPTAALAVAGVLFHKPAEIKNPLVILCGGNVDIDYIID